MATRFLLRALALIAARVLPWISCACLVLPLHLTVACAGEFDDAQATTQPIVFKIQGTNERLEMVVNSSRILTLDKKVPQVQAANRDLVELTPLSATQVQILAKKPGVTQVNLWDEQQKIHTIDVIVYPDARELTMLLQAQFPTTSLKVVPTASSVIISGHVDDPNQISRIVQIAEDFYPKVINNITIAGAQQVLLKVKVLEVSRTGLRKLGFDFRGMSGQSFYQSAPSQVLGTVAGQFAQNPAGVTNPLSPLPAIISSASSDTLHMSFGIVNPNSAFFGFIDALQKRQLATILAEPNLTAYSGRPASFLSGGQFPVPVPQSLGTISVQWKDYGTKVDFVPIVLGNGAIRLEVFPSVTELDETHSAVINGQLVPALEVREAHTGVEMRAGQTLALAGLVQQRRIYETRGIPWAGDLPYVGALFRNMTGTDEEVELLLLVTPQFVEAMDPCEVPTGGPGLSTSSPNDVQFYWKGHLEVPRCPADDACRPSHSPGLMYEYGRPQGGPLSGQGGPGGPGGVSVGDEGSEEVIESPSPSPAARRGKPAPGGSLPPGTASATPRRLERFETTSTPFRSAADAASDIDNRTYSYKPNNPTKRGGSAAARQPQTRPGMIGPVGYDVNQ